MPSLLLDTHILFWWVTNQRHLNARQIRTLEQEERRGPLAISAVTLRELALAIQRGRLEVELPLEQWLDELERDPLIEILPITSNIAVKSVRLGPDFHKDPADQIIVATALCHGLPLMTTDDRIRKWGRVMLA